MENINNQADRVEIPAVKKTTELKEGLRI